jgi:hypothetical protein
MSGIPMSATEEMVMQFFEEFTLTPLAVDINDIKGENGAINGIHCYVVCVVDLCSLHVS